MATNSVNAIDATLRATSPRLIVTAVTINSTSGGGSFVKTKNSATLSPANIVLTASPTGLTSPTYQWYYANSNAPSTWISISGATANTYTVVNSTFYNPATSTGHLMTGSSKGTQVVYKCVATQAGWASAESTLVISYSQQTNDVPIATLSKTSLSLPTTALDVVDYSASSCSITVSIGGVNIPYHASNANSYSVAVSQNNITPGSATIDTTTVANDTRSFGVMSGMAAGQVTATITYTVTARDIDGVATTIKLVQTITKATAGVVATTYNIATSAEVITKAAPDAATNGVYSSTTIQGKQVSSTTSNYGWVTVTANGDTEAGTATNTAVTPVTLSPLTTAGKSSYTIKLYNQATVSGATLLATKVLNVVFAGSTGSTGSAGSTAVFAYRIVSGASLPSAPAVGSGTAGGWLDSNNTPNSGSPTTEDGKWYALPPTALSTNLWCFQVSGTKSSSNVYTWQSQAYLATFKVGRLSALSAQMGQVELDTAGAIYSTGTSYNGNGIFLGYSGAAYKFSVGDGSNSYFAWDGTSLSTQAYTLYGYYTLNGTNILGVTRVLPTLVPVVYIRDLQEMTISSISSSTDTIVLGAGFNTKHLSVGLPIKFSFTGGGLAAIGTIYYVKTILSNNSFNISSTAGGGVFDFTSNLTNPGYLTLTSPLTTKLMEIDGNNTGAALDVVNRNTDGGAIGAYGYLNGATASQVVLGQGGRAINLVQGGIKFNPTFTNDTDPNTLDDYEEGTWTPTITATGLTPTSTNVSYTKIGRAIHFSIAIAFSSGTGTSGNVLFTLPTTPNVSLALTVMALGTVAGFTGNVQAWTTVGSSSVIVGYVNTATGNDAGDFATKVKVGTDLRISGYYW